MAANDLEQARAIAEQVIASDPTSGEAQILVRPGQQGHTAEATPVRRAVQLVPHSSTRNTISAPHAVDRDLEARCRRYARQAPPGHAEARYYLGLTQEGLGRLGPATTGAAVRLNPSLAVARRRAGYCAPDIRDLMARLHT
jgi:hypothetical protein